MRCIATKAVLLTQIFGVGSVCLLAVAPSAQAACTIPAGTFATGDTTTCTGVITEESYTFGSPVLNGTIINDATWTETGDLQNLFGASVIGPTGSITTNYTGLTIINNGSVSWTGATATGVPAGDRTMSVLGAHFQTETVGGLSYINNGDITGVAASTALNTFIGMGLASRSGVNYAENAGSINIDGSQITSGAFVVGISAYAASVDLLNTGDIVVNSGRHLGIGMGYNYFGIQATVPVTSASRTRAVLLCPPWIREELQTGCTLIFRMTS